MVVKKRQKRFAVRFELGFGALFGLGVVIFCIFLWMFLLGVWAGQTVLSPSSSENKKSALTRLAADIWQDSGLTFNSVESTTDLSQPEEKEPSLFSLQVGSFRDHSRAENAVSGWKKLGYTVFSFSADENGKSNWRVFVGRFENLADANASAAALERSHNVRPYITLLPEKELRK